jgi:hypothetical protein
LIVEKILINPHGFHIGKTKSAFWLTVRGRGRQLLGESQTPPHWGRI